MANGKEGEAIYEGSISMLQYDLGQLFQIFSSFLSHYFPGRPTNSPNQTTLSPFSSQNTTHTLYLWVRGTISTVKSYVNLYVQNMILFRSNYVLCTILRYSNISQLFFFLIFYFQCPFGCFVSLLLLCDTWAHSLMTRSRSLKKAFLVSI